MKLLSNYKQIDINYEKINNNNTTFYPKLTDGCMKLGFTIIWIPPKIHQTSKFVIYSFFGEYFELNLENLNNESIYCFPEYGHYVSEKNTIVFHANVPSQLNHSILFDINDLGKISISLICVDPSGIWNKDCCVYCAQCFKDVAIDKIPNYYEFETLPNDDRIFS